MRSHDFRLDQDHYRSQIGIDHPMTEFVEEFEPLIPMRLRSNADFLTPRDVERRYPALSRRLLANRRAHGLPPQHEVDAGCVMYAEAEIERFVSEQTNTNRTGVTYE